MTTHDATGNSVTDATWHEVLEDFTASCVGSHRPTTIKFYRDQMRPLTAWAIVRKLAVKDFTAKSMRAYMALRATAISTKTGKPVSDSTRRGDACVARVFFRFAFREGYISHDPLREYIIPKRPKAHVRTPSLDEIQILLNSIQTFWDPGKNASMKFLCPQDRHFLRSRDYAMACMLVETGLRIGELRDLDYADFRLQDRLVIIRDSKTHESREVPFGAGLSQALEPWLVIRAKLEVEREGDMKSKKDPRCSSKLFISRFGDAVNTHHFGRAWGRYLKFADAEHFTRHSIRHYTLTALARQNVVSAARIAGHKDLRVTQGYIADDMNAVRADQEAASPLGRIMMHKDTLRRRKGKVY